MAELLEMLFGLLYRVCPENHLLDGGRDPHVKGQFSLDKGATHCKVYGPSAVSGAKRLNQ